MNPDGNGRAWVAKVQWKGAAKPFWFGTVYVRLGATHQEIEAAVIENFSEIIPHDFPKPDIIELTPGCLIFMPEKEKVK